MKRLLDVRPKIDAVFAANDPSAIGAMKAIWEAGLRVPDDIAVVGVGDIALGDLLRVPLTTVGWSRQDQGRHAAELLLNGLDLEEDPPQRIVIPPRLIVRARMNRGAASGLVHRPRCAPLRSAVLSSDRGLKAARQPESASRPPHSEIRGPRTCPRLPGRIAT
jgi:hypothetical protein